MRIKPKTAGQKIADTMTTQVDKLEGNDLILQLQKYLDEGRGSSLEQILMGRAIAELNGIRISEYVPPSVRTEIPPPHGAYTTGDCTLSIENVMKICREDEQNQLAEMLHLQDEANFNNEQFNNNKGDMK